MKPERECSPIQAVMEPLKGLSLGDSSAMEDVVTSDGSPGRYSNVMQPPTVGVDYGHLQQRPRELGSYQHQTPNLEQYHQQVIPDSGQCDQQSNSNNNNEIAINFNKHYSTNAYHQQQVSTSAGWSYVPQSPFNAINNNGCDDSIRDPQQEDMIDQQQQNLSQFQEGMSQHQQSMSQFQEGMTQLQQDMSQARMATECPLQSVYLERLQELVPWVPKDEQLPKLQLVQAVIDYINMLQDQLEGGGGGEGGSAVNADVGCQGFSVADGYCQEALAVDTRIKCSDVNSCHDSSEASSPSPPPSPSRVVGVGGGGGQEPPSPHLFTHLQEKHMVNELSQLQMVTALSMNDTPSPVCAGEEALDVDSPYRRYHFHHHHHQQQIVDGFSNEHQQIMSDLRHLRMKDPVSAMAAATQRQMVEETGEDRAAATNGIGHTNGIGDINGGINGCTLNNGVPHQQYNNTQQMYSAHHHGTYSAVPHQQDQQQGSAQYPQPHPVSIFPFPAPPSPQAIKAARKKKMLLKKQMQQQQQQQQQDFCNSEC